MGRLPLPRASVIALATLCACGLASGAASAEGSSAPARPIVSSWQSKLLHNHPLAGKLWGTSKAAPQQVGSWDAAIAAARIVITGEVHDNADHHAIQALVLDPLLPLALRPAAVFEHLRADQQGALDAFNALAAERRTLDEFLKVVDWEKSGWAKYDLKPLFQAVLAAGLPIYAGDPPRDLVRKAAKEGRAALPPEELTRLALDIPLGEKHDNAMLTEIEESHCGLMPKSALGGMAFAQRLRDAYLADAALKARERHGSALVFAGNGHARADRGIGWYIERRAPGTVTVATQLLEVEDGKTDPETYLPRDPDGNPAADYVIFTPRAARPDPCEEMRNMFKKRP